MPYTSYLAMALCIDHMKWMRRAPRSAVARQRITPYRQPHFTRPITQLGHLAPCHTIRCLCADKGYALLYRPDTAV